MPYNELVTHLLPDGYRQDDSDQASSLKLSTRRCAFARSAPPENIGSACVEMTFRSRSLPRGRSNPTSEWSFPGGLLGCLYV